LRQLAIQKREAHVIAYCQPNLSQLGLGQHRFAAALDRVGFPVGFAGCQTHVEQMQLAVAGGEMSVRREQKRTVGRLGVTELDRQRTDQQPDLQFLGQR